jgi:ABC-type transporter Mla maintaining outer membrane lipid asymmetry ATPase subunit MlaF
MNGSPQDLRPGLAAMEMTGVAVPASHDPETVEIENVDWTVRPSDFWVVGGLPGSGKTDLLATAAGLMRPLRGVHRIFGRETSMMSEEELVVERLRIGLVFANEGRLFHHLTVTENLALPLCYHRNCTLVEAADRVRQVLEHTGLSDLAHSTPGTINRNLRERVALARALVLAPEVLLLDNPLRGMDPRQLRWWREFLSALCEGHPILDGHKMTLVVAADNLQPWIEEGTKFAILKEGSFLALGGREELHRSREPLLRDLMV